jgi:hypothetical protein
LSLFNALPRHDYHVPTSDRYIGAYFTHLLYYYRSCEHWNEVENGKNNKDVDG